MLALCILVLISLAVEAFVDLDADTRLILFYADTFVCVIFLGDFLFSLIRASDRKRYLVTWGWIDFLSSIPAVGYVRWGRAARAVRILRVLRGVRSVRVLGAFILRRRAEGALLAVTLASILAVVFASIAVLHLERAPGGSISTAADALWWSFVTITTVGYGDTFPITPEGRFLGAVLMATGVGLFGTFTAFVASWFLSPQEEEQDRELEAIRAELGEIRRLLSDREAAPPPAAHPADPDEAH
jgi:voltage-gated potassium channel